MHGSATECPRPRIDSLRPLSGPVEGGTLVTIEGSNLGIREEDVRGKIKIGNVPCELVNYEISVKIECRTGAVDKETMATVKVGNDAGVTESSVHFQYKDFRVERIAPTQGPQSGGTQVQIFGRHLNIGSSVIAYLDDYICHINVSLATNERLVCVTTASRSPEFVRTLTLIVDLANRTLQCKTGRAHNSNDIATTYSGMGMRYGACSIYNYTVDPKIMQIKPLKSFKSGGRMITVHGTNLHTIQTPQMEVLYGDESINKTDCTVINPNQMECPSPSVTEKFRTYFIVAQQQQQQQLQQKRMRRNVISNIDAYPTRDSSPYLSPPSAAYAIQETQLNFQISFVMDNVKSVRDLNKHFQHIRSNLIYVDDPVFFPFLNSIKLYKGDTLVIEGENLNLACDESDVIVTVGSLKCNVTSLALTQLVCTPPAQQPLSTDENGNENDIDLPLVVVRVGQKLRFPLGYLKYDLLKPYAFSQAMIVIAASTFVLALVLVFILIVYRRKTTQAEREYKKIQIQMDTLESNVRLECKQAFAELQTDILDLTADLENQGIPALDHVNYIMKVFFPGVSDHPILNGHKGRMNMLRTNYDAAMLQFEQLINNKFFLLTFIETLEAQRTFNIRDKVNVASLLMIVLMNKMEYATDILKWLLLRLVDKSVMTKHPHLMLRRTESVVEKMLTNYMAICMYSYLREYSGSSLFLLFKAIKHQVEKGLVDAITHEARYSLSEDRLLREQIDTNVVTLHILQDDLEDKVQCKVLDQDTITQVKSKILDALFKNTPFSMRPSVHDVDLEWRHGRGGHLTLQDEDLTTKTLNGWKRLNTLAHYGVKESAVMSLIARQHDSYNINTYSKNMYPNCYYINNTQTHVLINGVLDSTGMHHHHHPQLINQQQTLNTGTHKQQYCRVYHLVKSNMDEHYFGTAFGNKNQPHHPFLPPSNNCATVERTHKAIPEIYLTRLLATKGTIQKFVDDFFSTILTVNEKLPPAVKWLFDLLDDAARRHPETNDPKIIHAWKSNRFVFFIHIIPFKLSRTRKVKIRIENENEKCGSGLARVG
jgi:Plexin cytoplasmic RasGAP domain/IPT/TIG domain